MEKGKRLLLKRKGLEPWDVKIELTELRPRLKTPKDFDSLDRMTEIRQEISGEIERSCGVDAALFQASDTQTLQQAKSRQPPSVSKRHNRQ